jgi:hypothetical protein
MNTYSLQTHVPYVDLGIEEKDPTFSSQKDTDKHTTSRRNLRDTYSFPRQLILHFKLILINFHLQTTLRLFVLLLLSSPGMPSGLWHYEFIAQLLQGLYKNADKLPSRHTSMPTS